MPKGKSQRQHIFRSIEFLASEDVDDVVDEGRIVIGMGMRMRPGPGPETTWAISNNNKAYRMNE